MATQAQVRGFRRDALRRIRAQERLLDSKLEVLEREIKRLLKRKMLLETDDALRMGRLWTEVLKQASNLERALSDFATVTTR